MSALFDSVSKKGKPAKGQTLVAVILQDLCVKKRSQRFKFQPIASPVQELSSNYTLYHQYLR